MPNYDNPKRRPPIDYIEERLSYKDDLPPTGGAQSTTVGAVARLCGLLALQRWAWC